MSEEVRSMLLGTVPLDVIVLGALTLAVSRTVREPGTAARSGVARLAALALLVQSGHFAEELAADFHLRFPRLLELAPWPIAFFVSLNVGWLGVWAASILGLGFWPRVALFPIWFLALACAVNGVAHPLMAVAAAGYFPGLWTSPLSGVVGVLLLVRLTGFTRAAGAPLAA